MPKATSTSRDVPRQITFRVRTPPSALSTPAMPNSAACRGSGLGAALRVLAASPDDDGFVVHLGEDHRDHRVAAVVGGADVRDDGLPLLDLREVLT